MAKPNTAARADNLVSWGQGLQAGSASALTTEERLRRIDAMGQRVGRCIEFLCQAPALSGASAEARGVAVAAFYDRLLVLEGELSRITDVLRLA